MGKRKAATIDLTTNSPTPFTKKLFDPKILLNPRAALRKQSTSPEKDAGGLRSALQRLYGVKEQSHVVPSAHRKDKEGSPVKGGSSRSSGIVGKDIQAASTAAVEASRLLRPTTTSLPVAQSDIIDISDTEESDDVVVSSANRQANKVCLGMLKSSANAFSIPSTLCLLPNQWPAIVVTLVRGPSSTKTIHVKTSADKIFGTVTAETAIPLCRLMDLKLIETSARIPVRPKYGREDPDHAVSAILPLEITLYADSTHSERIAILLSQKNLFLSQPFVYDRTFPYVNPHATRQSFKPTHTQMQYGTAVFKTPEEMKGQIQLIFNNLVDTERIEEHNAPAHLLTPLLRHQKQALSFLLDHERSSGDADLPHSLWRSEIRNGRQMFRNVITPQVLTRRPDDCRGGILADEMGLGKTLSILSLILSTRDDAHKFAETSKKPKRESAERLRTSATLIICPLSVLSNWVDQINMHIAPTAKLRVLVHHEKTRAYKTSDLEGVDIMITTYALVSNDHKNRKDPEKEAKSILSRMNFFRIVLDEAHIVKDSHTQQSQAACDLDAMNRWCVTATPVQNGLGDLSALFSFLRLAPFDNKAVWAQYISIPMKAGDSVGVSRLQTLLKMRTLRRTKEIASQPSLAAADQELVLPPRTEELRLLKLNDKEQEIYNTHLQYYQRRTRTLGKAAGIMNVLQCINRLRQICIHLGILADEPSEDANPKKLQEDEEIEERLCCECGFDMEIGDNELAYRNTSCIHYFCSLCAQNYLDENEGLEANQCPVSSCNHEIVLQVVQDEKNARKNIQKSQKGRKKQNRDLDHSTKIKALLIDLSNNKISQDPSDPTKSVVFSQFTSFLDLIGNALEDQGMPYARLDGTMPRDERASQMTIFKDDPTIQVMLVSTRAGGVGLNLTCAWKVYMMEPSWNPATEQQAMDRVHRLGQVHPVHYVRYIIDGSIESTMIALQKQKTDLADLSLSKNLSKEDDMVKRLLNLKSLLK